MEFYKCQKLNAIMYRSPSPPPPPPPRHKAKKWATIEADTDVEKDPSLEFKQPATSCLLDMSGSSLNILNKHASLKDLELVMQKSSIPLEEIR